jgi:hypothetical protein
MKWISPAGWLLVADLATDRTGETVTKSDREIMEILESYDLTGCAHSAAQLAGCDAKTVQRYVALRDAGGGNPFVRAAAARPKLIDGFLPKVEELVEASKAKIRADKQHPPLWLRHDHAQNVGHRHRRPAPAPRPPDHHQGNANGLRLTVLPGWAGRLALGVAMVRVVCRGGCAAGW